MSQPRVSPTAPARENLPLSWVDIILGLALLSSIAPGGLFWTIDPSWPRDLTSFFVLGGMALVKLIGKPIDRNRLLAYVYAAMCLLGMFTWILSKGSEFGLNFWAGWSAWLLSATFVLYALAYGRQRWPAWRRLLIGFAVALAAIQWLGILAASLGSVSVEQSHYGAFYGMRPIHAALALLILLGFLLVLTGPYPLSRSQLALALFLGFSVVISQHRSVWISLIVVTALLAVRFVRDHTSRGHWVGLLTPFAYMLLAVVVPTIGVSILPRSGGEVAESGLADVATSSNSLAWRFEMWTSRLEAERGLGHWLFGGVFGVNPVKSPGVGVMNPANSAHNMYVDVLVMLGLVGLVVVLAIFAIAALGSGSRLGAIPVFLWGLLAYGMFYYWPAWTWVVIGAALAGANEQPPQPVVQQDDPVTTVGT